MIKKYELIEALDELKVPFDLPKTKLEFKGLINKTLIITTLPWNTLPPERIEDLKEALAQSLPDEYTILVLDGAFGLQFLKLKETDAYPEDKTEEHNGV